MDPPASFCSPGGLAPALPDGAAVSARRRLGTRRRRWLEAELRCLLCGRLVGSVKEPLGNASKGTAFSSRAIYSSAAGADQPRRLRAGDWPRCRGCGGSATFGQLRTYTWLEDEPPS
jgi:hypothetical protein